MSAASPEGERALALRVTGRVQGVGYRAFAQREARRLGISGWVVNRADGSVEAAVYGPGAALAAFVALCREGPPAAMVEGVEIRSVDRGLVDAPSSDAYRF